MKKTRKLISFILCAMMIFTFIPVTGLITAGAEEYVTVTTANELNSALSRSGKESIRLANDISDKISDDALKTWVTVGGDKTLDLNGKTVKITIEKAINSSMILIPDGKSLTVFDSSEKKSGGLHYDADITSGNEYRNRYVFNNKAGGTLKIYGGDFNVGHYESFWGTKYAKRIYKMTTGTALVNAGSCTVYGGTFTGRNDRASSILCYNDGDMTIYDAYLYGKGGADGIISGAKSTIKVYAIEVDLNKEDAVENDHYISVGYPKGNSGITASMFAGDYKITKQSGDTIFSSSSLKIEPSKGIAPTFDNGETAVTIPVIANTSCEDIVSFNHFYKNPISINRPDNVSIACINWHYRIQYQNGYTSQWSDMTQGDLASTSWALAIKHIMSSFSANTNYKILLSPGYIYKGWSHNYTVAATDSVVINIVSGTTIVTFDANGGSVYPTKKAVKKDSVYGALPTPTRTGYYFEGWYTAKTGGTLVNLQTTVSTDASHTLYAHWKNTSKPTFTKNLPNTTYVNKGQNAVNFTIATEGGATEIVWQLYNGSTWIQLTTGEQIKLVYTDGTDYVYQYSGYLSSKYKMRCVASNSNGNTVSVVSSFSLRDKEESNPADSAEQFLFYVEEVYSVTGRGIILSGKVNLGKLKVNEEITVFTGSKTISAKVVGISMFGKSLNACEKGDTCGLIIEGVGTTISKSDFSVGNAVVNKNSSLTANTEVYGTFKMYTNAEGGKRTPVENNYRPQLFIGTSDVTCTMTNIGGSCVVGGDTMPDVKLTLISGRVMYYGQELTIREGGRTIGTFTVTNVTNKSNGYVKLSFDYQGGGVDPYQPYKAAGGAKDKYELATLPEFIFAKSGEVIRTSYGELPSPVKEGFKFTGWYTTPATGGERISASNTAPYSSKTYYAHYESLEYITIKYDSNGGESIPFNGIMGTDGIYKGLTTPKRAGYTFMGWYDPLGNKAVEGEVMAYKLDHTLTAKWELSLATYPVFTKDLPEALDLSDKIHPVDEVINYSISVAADDATSYEWFIQPAGSETWISVAKTDTFVMQNMAKTFQKPLISNGGGKLKCVATGANGNSTDSTICTLTFTKPTEPTVSFTKGDVDNDGQVTVSDARLVLRAAIKLTGDKDKDGNVLELTNKESREYKAADVDGTEGITVTDARLVLRVAIKLESFS